MKTSHLFPAVALTTLTLALSACQNNTSNRNSAEPTAILVIQQSADIPTLDPGTTYDTSSGQVVENLYETLVGYDGSSLNDLKGVLATNWEELNDGRQYRFTLRDGVQFHSGNAMTCADAEYSMRRNLVTNTGESGNWFLAESLLGTSNNASDDPSVTWARISSAVTCDGDTLVFNLPRPDPAFLPKLAYVGQSVVDSQHAIDIGEWNGTEATWREHVGQNLLGSPLANQPSGTGAYRLLDKTASTVTAEAFSDYWGERGNIKNVIIQKVPEQATRIQAFLKGDADLIETGGRDVIETQLRDRDGISILDDLPDTSAFGISMNQNIRGGQLGSGRLDGQGIPANFFSDVDVRRGFAAAFNVPEYIEQVQRGQGEVRNFLLPESFPGYDPTVNATAFDLDAARTAFQRAWGGQVWQNGFTVNISYRAGSRPAQTGMEMLKQNIESINPKFRVNIVPKEWSQILADSRSGAEAMVMTGWAPDYADPDNFVHTFYSGQGFFSPRTGINDPQIDAWINETRSTTDDTRRDELYRQVAERALDQAYFIVMPSNPGVLAYRSNIEGIDHANYNPMNSFNAGTFWKNLNKI